MRIWSLTPLALAACNPQPATEPAPTPDAESPADAPEANVTLPVPTATSSPAKPPIVASDLIRQQWAKAENRDRCAPIGFTDVGGAKGVPRPATFSGGWAVAFDVPGTRSAFGVAGPGVLEADRGPPYQQSRRLTLQWPYYMELEQLERPSFAGYGLEGAKPYRDDNVEGRGENSLAYVRIHRQQCTYNVWSRLGRAHLEVLLGGLRLLSTS